MDEPLSNLDAKLRNQMRAELIKLKQRIDTTFIYVTHDQTEAMTLGDRIVIMKDGYIQQIGTPHEVFDHPANLFVAGFIGTTQMNLFEDVQLVWDDNRFYVALYGARIWLSNEKQAELRAAGMQSRPVILGVRPEHITLCKDGTGLAANVDLLEMMGSQIHLHLSIEGRDVVLVLATVDLPPERRIGIKGGDRIRFIFGGDMCHLFDPETGENLIKK